MILVPPTLDPRHEIWMQEPILNRLWTKLSEHGETRIVGGAVRDALIKRPVHEIDLATVLSPERVTLILSKAGFKVLPTGMAHGTVTAVHDKNGFEITTLRQDIETDGRHAKIKFIDDWKSDAARRDFTINALYLDHKGTVFDYYDGWHDLQSGRIRFIGNARDRIQEDVLRIFRYFRFLAWFSKADADPEALSAIRELVPLVKSISRERIWRELLKLLAAADPIPAWDLMLNQKVLSSIVPEASNRARLNSLLEIEKKFGLSSDPILRLSALLPTSGILANELGDRLKLSRAETEKLRNLSVVPSQIRGRLDPLLLRHHLYEYGVEDFVAATILLATEDSAVDVELILKTASNWCRPEFPLRGADLLKKGVSAGPTIGQILKSVEEWWRARDFLPTQQECLKQAQEFINTSMEREKS